jgi:hypothetical protein
MPINCLNHFLEYNACTGCGNRQGKFCHVFPFSPFAISDILTIEERVAILEDRLTPPKPDTINITRQDYQKLQRRVLLLEEKLNKHIGKPFIIKSKYE